MNIKEMVKKQHQAMIDKGFYPEGEDKNTGELLMLIVSELSEALEADRNNRFADTEACIFLLDECKGVFGDDLFKKHIKDTFEDEISDVFLRLFDLCGYLEIPIEKHIAAKMEYNKNRLHKHGKNY